MEEVFNHNKNPLRKVGWKAVAIGQTTGVLLGAGLLHLTRRETRSPNTADHPESDAVTEKPTLEVATVNDSLSFEHALTEAQAHVGDDGVFVWRGGVYASCDEEQWNAKPEEEKQHIIDQVDTEITIDQVDTEITIDQVDTEITADEMEDGQTVSLEEDGFIHVTDDHGHDYVYVNNERIEIFGSDDVSIVGSYGTEDENGIISGFAASDNAHVIHTMDDVMVIDDAEEDDIADGEVVDMQTGEIYSQPVALVQQEDDSQDVMIVDDEEDVAIDDIPVDLAQIETMQMDAQQMDVQTEDNSLADDGFFDPGTDDFHAIDGGY